MSLFGIPLFVPYEYYVEFITNNFSLVLTDDALYLGYLLSNFMYLFGLFLFICLVKKVAIIIINHWF